MAQDARGKTALHVASTRDWQNGSASAVDLILAATQSADVGFQDDLDRTALHWAAKTGFPEAVALLLGRMASATAELQDADGATALHLAAEQGHMPVIEQLLASWTSVRQQDRS